MNDALDPTRTDEPTGDSLTTAGLDFADFELAAAETDRNIATIETARKELSDRITKAQRAATNSLNNSIPAHPQAHL
ncbi:MAG: hypothetical protein AAB373_06745 [Patescibacteria group bacterium]